MDKNASYKIIKDTLENAFDKEKYLFFTKNLLNQIDESKAFHAHGYIPEVFKNYVRTYERLGTYTDPEGKKIDILIVYLQKETSLERARTAQRNFVARYLKDRDQKDAGLVAFVSPNSEDWRFSLIKMEYKIIEGKSGKVKVKEEFTPARRWSFLVGANENSYTAKSRLAPILQEDENNPALNIFEEAFNIEKVAKEFFEKYRDLFLRIKENLDDIVKRNLSIKKDFTVKGVDTVDFSKKLLGQIVFLYFLQKKGWFGVDKNKEWGTGSKRFIRDLFDKKVIHYGNFFNDILEPLFYDALARDHSDIDHYNELFKSKIPFLNGGLFDPINNYDWVNTDILLPNELFSNDRKTKEGDTGDGILDVFDRYNFTVKEDEPLEKEVAIDPEMLGKVFENLLEVKDRKSKGTYYTPREIVHYMCEQSLINYLASELTEKVSKEDAEKLIKHGESVIENESRVENEGKETDKYYYKLPESIRKNAKEIDEKLADIKVCDPAIGSGAFPVGMMSEIVKARTSLNAYLCENGKLTCRKRTPYDFKFECIQSSLFGVDIDPSAVEIAKLRLWLSLVVDENDIKQINPLPNLDYKIMQGNSLIEEFEGVKLFDEKLVSTSIYDKEKDVVALKEKQSKLQSEYINLHSQNKLSSIKKIELDTELKKINDQLKKISKKEKDNTDPGLFDIYSEAKKKSDELNRLHKEFFSSTQKKKKEEIKKRIDHLEWELIEATLEEQGKVSEIKKLEEFKKSNIKPFFLWKLHFSDVFQEKGGFDVVIANPPYVRQEEIKEYKIVLQKAMYEVYNSTSDLYTYFYERSYHILKPNGHLCFISSNKWMRAKYGDKLRRFFKEKTTLRQIIDFKGYPIFDATVDTNIILFQKIRPSVNSVNILNIEPDFTAATDITNYFNIRKIEIDQSVMDDNCFTFGSAAIFNLKKKIEKKGILLKNWDVKIYRGIITGFNEAFIINEQTKSQLCKEDHKSAKILKPILRGRDIDRYAYKWAGLYLIKIESGWTNRNRNKRAPEIFFKETYPAIYKHLKAFDNKEGKGKGLYNRDDQGDYWWELRDCAYYQEFEKSKLIYKDIGEKLSFSYENEQYFCNNTLYFLASVNKYLLAILNSAITNFYYRQISSQLGNVALRAFTIYIECLPVAKISEIKQKPFISLVDKILSITKTNDYFDNKEKQAKVQVLEAEINQKVYELYGLTDDEIQIIESNG